MAVLMELFAGKLATGMFIFGSLKVHIINFEVRQKYLEIRLLQQLFKDGERTTAL
jgi:hypothetical protein